MTAASSRQYGTDVAPFDHRSHTRPSGCRLLVINETARIEQAGLAGCIHPFQLASQSDSAYSFATTLTA